MWYCEGASVEGGSWDSREGVAGNLVCHFIPLDLNVGFNFKVMVVPVEHLASRASCIACSI